MESLRPAQTTLMRPYLRGKMGEGCCVCVAQVLECLGGSKFNFQERMGEGEGKGGGKEK
jgi:hypothetical protein